MPKQLTPTRDLPIPTEGDDVPIDVSFTDGDGNARDITGWTVSLTIARYDGTVAIEKDNTTHDDATGGKTSFALSASETSGLADTMRYDIQVVKGDGTTQTAVIGQISWVDGVTDRTVA